MTITYRVRSGGLDERIKCRTAADPRVIACIAIDRAGGHITSSIKLGQTVASRRGDSLMVSAHNRQRAHALLDQVADSDTERAEVRRVLSGIGHCSQGHEACPTPYTCDYDDADQLRAARGILGWLIAALALWALMASVVIWIGG